MVDKTGKLSLFCVLICEVKSGVFVAIESSMHLLITINKRIGSLTHLEAFFFFFFGSLVDWFAPPPVNFCLIYN